MTSLHWVLMLNVLDFSLCLGMVVCIYTCLVYKMRNSPELTGGIAVLIVSTVSVISGVFWDR